MLDSSSLFYTIYFLNTYKYKNKITAIEYSDNFERYKIINISIILCIEVLFIKKINKWRIIFHGLLKSKFFTLHIKLNNFTDEFYWNNFTINFTDKITKLILIVI